MDLGSDTERSCVQCGANAESTFSWIVNAFRPAENYGVSHFDTTHLITADWVYLLPVGGDRGFFRIRILWSMLWSAAGSFPAWRAGQAVFPSR